MKAVVFDAETNILNKTIGKMKASPFYPDNDITLGCFFDSDTNVYYYLDKKKFGFNHANVKSVFAKYDILVGHNIKFDLLYLRKNYNQLYLDWVSKGGSVWDTQIVEYLLSGQTHTYPKLDDLSVKYGGELKDDKIKEYWDNDIDTADIPMWELLAYLQGDVHNTDKVFQAQQEQVMAKDMIPLVTAQMDALLALVEMEYNGIQFDSAKALVDGEVIRDKANTIEERLVYLMSELLPEEIDSEITPASSVQLSALLFGGDIKCARQQPMLDPSGNSIKFKSGVRKGEVRTKKAEWSHQCIGQVTTSLSSQGKSGRWSTDDGTIKSVCNYLKALPPVPGSNTFKVKELVDTLLEWRKLTKDYNTYYVGLGKLVFPDGKIHPNYNQCATATGRLSSSQPNAQNMSGKKGDD